MLRSGLGQPSRWLVAALASLIMAVGAAAAGPASASSTTHGPSTVRVPLTVCPSSFVYGGGKTVTTGSAAGRHTTIQLSGSGNGLAVYTDSQNIMNLLAPANLACRAHYALDGSGGIVVYMAGERPPSPIQGTWIRQTQSAVVGYQTSACWGCAQSTACPLFSVAAHDFGEPCPNSRPPQETVNRESSAVVEFADPPGVVGDDNPSGGGHWARGVMIYAPNHALYTETCTLPASRQSACSSSFSYFTSLYRTTKPITG